MIFPRVRYWDLLEDTVQEQILVLPDEVLKTIDGYLDLFNQSSFLEETVIENKIDAFDEKLSELFDAVINEMRHDLSLEKLDTG